MANKDTMTFSLKIYECGENMITLEKFMLFVKSCRQAFAKAMAITFTDDSRKELEGRIAFSSYSLLLSKDEPRIASPDGFIPQWIELRITLQLLES